MLWTWGLGVHGRLGHNDAEDQKIPKQVIDCPQSVTSVTSDSKETNQVESMSEKRIYNAACGGSHTAVLIARSWVPDDESKKCMHCGATFTFINRRVSCL